MALFGLNKQKMVSFDQALTGRDTPLWKPGLNIVKNTPMAPPYPENSEVAVFAMGCFWGAERIFWKQQGIYTTAVGYCGGFTKNPTYEEVCTGKTGHAESVLVVFFPEQISYKELLRLFFENHDPTQFMRQGNDIGTQYRSAIFTTSEHQFKVATEVKTIYNEILIKNGYQEIKTEIKPFNEFYFAEDYHQQYLEKNPYGYCGLQSLGLPCPT